jgi:transposase
MWIPPEDIDPVVLHAPTRKSVALFGAVRVQDGCFVPRQANTFNATSFALFLGQLLRHRRNGRKMLVIVDNARWHHARQLQPWLHDHRHALQLDFLPPYSPNLNPVERVWKLTRYQCTHNRYFPVLDDLIATVWNHFNMWSRPNETLRRLCAIT